MKKILFGLSALLMVFVMSSCGGGASKIKSIAEDISENGEDWDTEEWTSVIKEAMETSIAFWESDPSEKEVDEFEEATDEFKDAISDLNQKALTKVQKVYNKKEIQKLIEKEDKVAKKARKKLDDED